MIFEKKIFGMKIRELRASKKVKQNDLAEILGVTKTQISEIENGKTTTSIERLVILADYFNVSIDYLVGRSDNPENVTGEKEQSIESPNHVEKEVVSPSGSEQIVVKFKTGTMETELKFPIDISKEKIEDALEAVSAVFNEKIVSPKPKPRPSLPPAVGGDIPNSETVEDLARFS